MHNPKTTKNESKAKSLYRAASSPDFSWERTMQSLRGYNREVIKMSKAEEILIPLDLSTLDKPEARKMEALDRVGKEAEKGYWMIGAVGILEEEKLLLECSLYSVKEEGFLSRNKEIEGALLRIKEQTLGKKAIYLMDMGFDDAKMMKGIEEQGDKFIVRAYHDRGIEVKGKRRKLKAYLKEKKIALYLELQVKVKEARKKVKFSLKYIPEGYIEVEGKKLKVGVIYLESKEEELREMMLITNLEVKDGMGAVEVVRKYLRRWVVEDFFKFVKDSLKLEAIRVLELGKIRALLSWVMVAAGYIYGIHSRMNGEEEIIRVLGTLGGWIGRGKIGKEVLKRGLERFLELINTIAILEALGADIGKMRKAIVGR